MKTAGIFFLSCWWFCCLSMSLGTATSPVQGENSLPGELEDLFLPWAAFPHDWDSSPFPGEEQSSSSLPLSSEGLALRLKQISPSWPAPMTLGEAGGERCSSGWEISWANPFPEHLPWAVPGDWDGNGTRPCLGCCAKVKQPQKPLWHL